MRAKNLLAKDPNGEWVSGRPSECLEAVHSGEREGQGLRHLLRFRLQ